MATLEHDKRVCVYPAYLNSKYTVAQGRRIAKEKACEEPWVPEICNACKALQVPAEIEPKSYPRDYYLRGRVRVQLYKPDGTPANPKIPTRHALFLAISELLSSDTGRLKQRAAAQARVAEAQKAQQAGPSGDADKEAKAKDKEKGKGKKGRRK